MALGTTVPTVLAGRRPSRVAGKRIRWISSAERPLVPAPLTAYILTYGARPP